MRAARVPWWGFLGVVYFLPLCKTCFFYFSLTVSFLFHRLVFTYSDYYCCFCIICSPPCPSCASYRPSATLVPLFLHVQLRIDHVDVAVVDIYIILLIYILIVWYIYIYSSQGRLLLLIGASEQRKTFFPTFIFVLRSLWKVWCAS